MKHTALLISFLLATTPVMAQITEIQGGPGLNATETSPGVVEISMAPQQMHTLAGWNDDALFSNFWPRETDFDMSGGVMRTLAAGDPTAVQYNVDNHFHGDPDFTRDPEHNFRTDIISGPAGHKSRIQAGQDGEVSLSAINSIRNNYLLLDNTGAGFSLASIDVAQYRYTDALVATGSGNASFYSLRNNGSRASVEVSAEDWLDLIKESSTETTRIRLKDNSVELKSKKIILNGGAVEAGIKTARYDESQDFVQGFRGTRHLFYKAGMGSPVVTLPDATHAEPGEIVTVSDLGADCAQNNISLDAGAGNKIVTTTADQVYIMRQNGQSMTLIKASPTEWKAI